MQRQRDWQIRAGRRGAAYSSAARARRCGIPLCEGESRILNHLTLPEFLFGKHHIPFGKHHELSANAAQGDGYCGFYMRCPDGTNVTITLFVGKHRKGPISAKFEAATGKGLPDFCDLEPQIDPVSDSVTVGIELRNNDW